ncbi:MAG: hypothetical protein M3203_15485 [Actinomycetota bacterium]|nr:hypothetical protein [Actinomycetota bacterium]
MPVPEPRYIEFDAGHLDEVVAVMEAITRAEEGWINFQPAVRVEDVPPPGSGFFSLFSGRGPAVPLGTWTPPSSPRRGRPEPAMIGLQHPAGGKAKPLLERLGHPVPDGWVVTQDYVKKGIVVALPPGTAHEDIVRWLLAAAAVLTTVPLTGEWRAEVYGGSAVPG